MATAMNVATREVDGVTILDVSGRITLGEGSVILRKVLRDLANNGKKKILLNLLEVAFIDSAGIGELVRGLTTVRSRGGDLKLLNVPKRVRDLLQITKLLSVFEIKEDEASAVASFG